MPMHVSKGRKERSNKLAADAAGREVRREGGRLTMMCSWGVSTGPTVLMRRDGGMARMRPGSPRSREEISTHPVPPSSRRTAHSPVRRPSSLAWTAHGDTSMLRRSTAMASQELQNIACCCCYCPSCVTCIIVHPCPHPTASGRTSRVHNGVRQGGHCQGLLAMLTDRPGSWWEAAFRFCVLDFAGSPSSAPNPLSNSSSV